MVQVQGEVGVWRLFFDPQIPLTYYLQFIPSEATSNATARWDAEENIVF